MALVTIKTDDLTLNLIQDKWTSELNPLLNKATSQSIVLKSITLSSGQNEVNHRLGRTLQGWKLVRQRGPANIYDLQDQNQSPKLTLSLVSSATVIVDLEVF
jgi:hypothetical protein